MKIKYIIGTIVSIIIIIISFSNPEKYNIAMGIIWIFCFIISVYLLFIDKNNTTNESNKN